MKLKAPEWSQHFPIIILWSFPDTQGQLTPNLEPNGDFMVVLVVNKNGGDVIKNLKKDARVVTTLFIDLI